MSPQALAVPAIVCYSVAPTAYLTEHADRVAGLYDGFYFTCGSWDGGVLNALGTEAEPAKNPDWLRTAQANIEALKRVGATENLLGVWFGGDEAWPSSETLLSDEFTERMRRHFSALGRAARQTGFRGVSIDVEYPYPRYSLDHEIYTYDSYTPGDLMAAAYRRGRVSMSAVLDEFPEAVVFVLPGSIRTRPIDRQYMVGLLDEMAERDAPGGYHLATEYAYSLHDPVTQVAIARYEDPGMPQILSPATLEYWRRRCTMAPGVWPLHMVETGGENYPVRPWADELAELRQQMSILRATSKRYLWSFSGHAVWLLPSEAAGYDIGRSVPTFPEAEAMVRGWHDILRTAKRYDELPDADPRILRLFGVIKRFDEGALDADSFSEAFGTPGTWWTLGPLSNPHRLRRGTAQEALTEPISPTTPYYGRDGVVRWFRWPVHDPRGVVELRHFLDYLHTDDASVHMAVWVETDEASDALLHVNWDDGIIIWLGDEVVFDRRTYPPVGHGAFFRDRYQFEESLPIRIPAGRTRLALTEINSHGVWQFNLRITDTDGYPLPGLRFQTDER